MRGKKIYKKEKKRRKQIYGGQVDDHRFLSYCLYRWAYRFRGENESLLQMVNREEPWASPAFDMVLRELRLVGTK